MPTQVLDYSAGFPGAARIAAAGYVGAVRYCGFPGRRKCTSAGELADFTAHRIGMAMVFEDTATTWRGGRAAGARSMQLARAHATACGFPTTRPIYLAVDQDVVTSGEFGTMLEYLAGAGDQAGGAGLVGVYGEADVIDRVRAAELAAYFWQTVAWSRGRRTTAHLFQHVGSVTVGGIACDVNDVLADDWGQHTLEDTMSAKDAYDGVAQMIKDIRDGKANDLKEALQVLFWTTELAVPEVLENPTAEARLAVASQRLATLESEVTSLKQALAAGAGQPGGAVDLDALADKLVERAVARFVGQQPAG